ncbi:lipid-A-disaccharide synthase [Aquimarina agarilytica]|uniref:lipid-A-disaccharide synthase n=1 Tax=Aquimarina agarilytica TaxID=1087449 RepID=UPI000287A9A9|nr:lipid-A-disaccharide synthase [Aquimarina agarilytica]
MKYYIIAGEASGDLHGSNLIKELKKGDPSADIRCWGGDLMEAAGGSLVTHYKERAFMGFAEIIKNLFKILGFIKFCKKDIAVFKPDALIFIDNSGFNLRIAKWAKPKGYNTHYYISPQVWASRASRVKTIKATVDHMYVILPFVKDFYNSYNYPVHYVGHPLIDAIANFPKIDDQKFRNEFNLDERPVIALLPGSRKQEITKMLEIMLSLPDHYPQFQFVIAGAPSQEEAFYNSIIGNKSVTLIPNRTYDILSIAYSALVTSGTATLETALFKVPQVVCYKGGAISYAIAKKIIKLKYISLVNLVMDAPVVKELIQHEFTPLNLKAAFDIISNPEKRTSLFLNYYELELKLGSTGASKKTADLIIKSLK